MNQIKQIQKDALQFVNDLFFRNLQRFLWIVIKEYQKQVYVKIHNGRDNFEKVLNCLVGLFNK